MEGGWRGSYSTTRGGYRRRNGGRELKLPPRQNFIAIRETENRAAKTGHMQHSGSNIPPPQKKFGPEHFTEPARVIFSPLNLKTTVIIGAGVFSGIY